MKWRRETTKTKMKGLDWTLPGKTEVETQGREIQVEPIASQASCPKPESYSLYLLRPVDWNRFGQAPGTGCVG